MKKKLKIKKKTRSSITCSFDIDTIARLNKIQEKTQVCLSRLIEKAVLKMLNRKKRSTNVKMKTIRKLILEKEQEHA